MSIQGPTHSLASYGAGFECADNLAARGCHDRGTHAAQTSAPSPGIRYRRPFEVLRTVDFLVEPARPSGRRYSRAISGLMLNCASTSSHNACPPPKAIHELSSSAVMP